MTTQDDRIRALERAHQAAPTRETRDALRRALFGMDLDPFPRELWTPEWVEVFESSPNNPGARSVSSFPCNHGTEGEGCSLDVDAWFLDGRLACVRALHSPCPMTIQGVTSIPYDAYRALGWPVPRNALEGPTPVPLPRPNVISPLEEFQAEAGIPAHYYVTSYLDGVLIRSYCARCGHEGLRHEEDGACQHCECNRFLPPAACACGHPRESHEDGGGSCIPPDEEGVGAKCSCDRFNDGRPATCTPYCSERRHDVAVDTEANGRAHDEFFRTRPASCPECDHGLNVHVASGCMGAGMVGEERDPGAVVATGPACSCRARRCPSSTCLEGTYLPGDGAPDEDVRCDTCRGTGWIVAPIEPA